jgi:hypothetical protein
MHVYQFLFSICRPFRSISATAYIILNVFNFQTGALRRPEKQNKLEN